MSMNEIRIQLKNFRVEFGEVVIDAAYIPKALPELLRSLDEYCKICPEIVAKELEETNFIRIKNLATAVETLNQIERVIKDLGSDGVTMDLIASYRSADYPDFVRSKAGRLIETWCENLHFEEETQNAVFPT